MRPGKTLVPLVVVFGGIVSAACAGDSGVSTVAAVRTPTTTSATVVPEGSASPPQQEVQRPAVTVPTEPEAMRFGSCDQFVRGASDAPSPSWECGTLSVPMVHGDPDSVAVELAVTRLAGTRSRGDVLVINPGGPGGAGVRFAWSLAERFPPDLLRLFDIVSWDPRGVGASEPAISCPRNARWADGDLLERCAGSTGPLLSHVSTPNHVHDLEALRVALGAERLNYIGYSYGTYLGALYANEYPGAVGRFVLDGAVDPDAGTVDAPRFDLGPWYAEDGSAETRRRFFELCDAAVACDLGDDSAATYASLVDAVVDLPTERYPGEDRIDGATLDAVVDASMFDPFNWGVLATALEDAAQGDASTLDALADLLEVSAAYFGELVDLRGDNESIANLSIYCADFQVDPALPAYCDGVPANDVVPAIGPVDLDEPALVIGTALDPSTPGRHAIELAARLGDAVVVSWGGIGHTAFPLNSLCIDDVVVAYLVDGEVPEDAALCPFVDGITGDDSIAEYLFALPPDYVRPWIVDELLETCDGDVECGADRLSGAGDRIVTHVVLGVDSPASSAAIDKAVAACQDGVGTLP